MSSISGTLKVHLHIDHTPTVVDHSANPVESFKGCGFCKVFSLFFPIRDILDIRFDSGLTTALHLQKLVITIQVGQVAVVLPVQKKSTRSPLRIGPP
jgi:hypothetical protein